MSGEMSETIFVVNQIGSGCYGFPSEPQIDKYGNWCGYGWFRLSESYMPPPGECWEYRLTRKGDIDTDGDPIGWKIVGIGKDGSVLCEKGNGQRRRYSFGDVAKEQPSGEAWERLLNVVADYVRNVGIVGPRGERIKEAWKAYEAAQSAEPQRPKIVCLCGSTRFAKEFADANERETLAGNIVLSVGCFRRTAPDGQREPMEESVKAALDVLHKRKIDLADEVLVLNVGGYIGDSTRSEIEHARKTGKRVRYLEPGRTPTNDPPLPASTDEPPESQIAIQQGMIERLTKERDEALRELANERSISDQVIDERNATIAELRSELDETRTERHAYKSRLREFCQRLVDMVGAEGPEDVQGMLDKVNAEINRLKQSIDSLSANLADKEGFLNSAGDEIEVLTKERDEARSELRSLSTISGQTIAELRAKLERPEMPECVREFVDAVLLEVPGLFAQKIAAVRDHYAPPLKFEVGGVYISSDERSEWELLKIARNGTMLFWGTTSEAVMRTDESGVSNIGGIKIVKRVR